MMAGTFHFEDEVDDQEWDAFVGSSPLGNSFLRSDVLRDLAARETPRARLLRVAARDGDARLAGGWAVLQRRRGPVRYATGFPLFYAGPVLAAAWLEPERRESSVHLLHGLARRLTSHLDILDTEVAPGLGDARGLVYAGCAVLQAYAHLWPAGPADEVSRWPNRSKRRAIQQARQQFGFDWVGMEEKILYRFDELHNRTLEKFRWEAPESWRRALLGNMADLSARGICRLFAAFPPGNPQGFHAAVSVLLSPPHQTAWLWRVAYEPGHDGLVAALYVSAAEALKRELGPAWTVNFGGSPRISLSLFKDYLGAAPHPHWRVRWQRPGWTGLLWEAGQTFFEGLRRRRLRLRNRPGSQFGSLRK